MPNEVEVAKSNKDDPNDVSNQKVVVQPLNGGEELQTVAMNLDPLPRRQSELKRFINAKEYANFQRRTTSIFKYAATENSALFEVGDDIVDPLMWNGTMGWRQYTGFLIYVLMIVAAPIIGFTFFNIIEIRSTDLVPSDWWKCGVFCGFVWSFILNSFTFEMIRKKVPSNKLFEDFNPSWLNMIFCWLLVGVLMMIFWVALYLINHKLMWMHGTQAAMIGLISGPTIQCLWITPKNYPRQETKQLLIVTLATAVLFIPVQALCLSVCLVFYIQTNENVQSLIPYYIVRMIADYVVEVVCKHGRASSFRIIFININALMNRLLILWALAKEFNLGAIMFTVVIDFAIVFMFAFVVAGPLYIHTHRAAVPRALLNWILGREEENLVDMSKEMIQLGVCERAKWVYFTVLHSTGEIIMPWWQMFFYFLLYSTASRSALSGFERSVNGFPLIRRADLLKTAVAMGTFDILDFMMFTYIVRRKFPNFTPWRLLNVIVKKYNLLLALSVMSVVISLQCILLIDCRFDFTMAGFTAFFNPDEQNHKHLTRKLPLIGQYQNQRNNENKSSNFEIEC